MTDTFRDLCAELLAAVEHEYGDPPIDRLALSQRARAALAEGAGVEPTDAAARKLIQRLADDLGLWLEYNQAPSNLPLEEERSLVLVREARRYLRRRSTYPRPIPVTERLPTEADCDARGWCWVLYHGYFTWTMEPPLGQDKRPCGWSYWLPAAAIPLPEATP